MRCEPANQIIQKLNGLKAVAEIVGVTPHTVMRWRTPRARGGTGGVIPHWHMPKLLIAARDRGIALEPGDFFPDMGQGQSDRVDGSIA